MKKESIMKRQGLFPRNPGCRAFSLIEVVISLGILTFALLPMMCLLSNGLHQDGDSRKQMQAADLATLLVTERRNAPTNTLASAVLPSLAQTYPTTAVTTWVNSAGSSCPQSQAAFRLSYQVGTNTVNSGVGQINLLFTWPPAADPGTAPGRYELVTQILLPQ